jgi:hypothetical protein
MNSRVKRLAEAGLSTPRQVVELVFHSGSVVEVACDKIEFVNVTHD